MNRRQQNIEHWENPKLDIYKIDSIFKAFGWRACFHPDHINYRYYDGDDFIFISIYKERKDIAYLIFTVGNGCKITLQQDHSVWMNLLDVIQDTIRKMKNPEDNGCDKFVIDNVKNIKWISVLERIEPFIRRTGFFKDEGLLSHA